MPTVSVRVLKDELSEYLRRAEAGERVTVTRDGKPVAALVALSELSSVDEGVHLARMVLAGKLSRTPQPMRDLPPLADAGPGKSVSRTILDERR